MPDRISAFHKSTCVRVRCALHAQDDFYLRDWPTGLKSRIQSSACLLSFLALQPYDSTRINIMERVDGKGHSLFVRVRYVYTRYYCMYCCSTYFNTVWEMQHTVGVSLAGCLLRKSFLLSTYVCGSYRSIDREENKQV